MTTKTVERHSLGAEEAPPAREIQIAYQVHTLTQMLWAEIAATQPWNVPQTPQPWTAPAPPIPMTGLDPFAGAQVTPWASGWPGTWAGPAPTMGAPATPYAGTPYFWTSGMFPR